MRQKISADRRTEHTSSKQSPWHNFPSVILAVPDQGVFRTQQTREVHVTGMFQSKKVHKSEDYAVTQIQNTSFLTQREGLKADTDLKCWLIWHVGKSVEGR